MLDKPTGWTAHGWSINSVASQWYNEQLKRGKNITLDQAKHDVEQSTCNSLLSTNGWDQWVEVTSEWKEEDYLSDNYDRETTSTNTKGELFAVVLPFCVKDGQLALKLMKWMVELTPKQERLLVLSHDMQTPPSMVEQIAKAAEHLFSNIKILSYSPPRADQWPPTIAFKCAANYMAKVGLPWFWLEPDTVPLKENWLDALQDAYWTAGKAFAGPVIPDMGHCNGTAIYPSNTPKRIPQALDRTRTAWDVTMKAEMIKDCHNLYPLFFHAWTAYNGQLHPYAGGACPSFPPGSPLLSQIPKESVVFHRCKDGSLIERMRDFKRVTA